MWKIASCFRINSCRSLTSFKAIIRKWWPWRVRLSSSKLSLAVRLLNLSSLISRQRGVTCPRHPISSKKTRKVHLSSNQLKSRHRLRKPGQWRRKSKYKKVKQMSSHSKIRTIKSSLNPAKTRLRKASPIWQRKSKLMKLSRNKK